MPCKKTSRVLTCLTSVKEPSVPAILLAALRRRFVSAARQQQNSTAAQDGKAGKTRFLLYTDIQ
jgi:hypothetical protein